MDDFFTLPPSLQEDHGLFTLPQKLAFIVIALTFATILFPDVVFIIIGVATLSSTFLLACLVVWQFWLATRAAFEWEQGVRKECNKKDLSGREERNWKNVI